MESDIKHLLGTALSLHQTGNITEALKHYHQALELDPTNPNALLFTAIAYCQSLDYNNARKYFEQIPSSSVSDNPGYYINYGLTLSELNETEQAISMLQKGAELDPKAFEAPFNLGRCYYRTLAFEDALIAFSNAHKLNPNDTQTLSYLGAINIELGNYNSGLNILEKAFSLGGESSFIRQSTGTAFEKQEHYLEAEKQYERAIILDSNNNGAHLGLSRCLARQGRFQEAISEIECTRESATPQFLERIECNLSTIAHLESDNDRAEIHAQNALKINPESAEANGLLALALSNTGRQIDAIEYFKKATSTEPVSQMHLINMSKNYTAIGLTEEAIATAQRAYQINIHNAESFSNLLLYLHYPSSIAASDIASLHKQFGEVFGGQEPITTRTNEPGNKSKPRIGFISGDFCVHPVQFFFEPLLKEFTTAQEIETILYSNTPKKDQVTKQYIEYATEFRDIRYLSDSQAADQIAADNLDVLIDLSGHTNNNRLLVMAKKPAPVQMTYIGYPDTTGLKEIDYRITDFISEPADSSELHTEDLLQLDGCFLTYQPPEHPTPRPRSSGAITFGSFNNIAKISSDTISCWAEILKKVPDSRLLLKCHGLNSEDLQRLLTPKFLAHDISEERLTFAGKKSNFQEHLDLYNSIDIVLDTYPYNGTTTTFEALLMSRPVISRYGQTHVSSVSKSILTALNAAELTCSNAEDYIANAVELANSPDRIEQYHTTLSSKFLKSPLCDSKLFYKKFIEALKKMQII